MNKVISAVAVSGFLLAASAPAAAKGKGYEYAQVVRAEPVLRQVRVSEPRRECFEEPVTERTVYRGYRDPAAPLFGAIIGGVIGHQFGGGSGKDAATVAGALIGANHASHHSGTSRRVVERTVYETRCQVVREARYEQRVEGYNVTYRYQGRTYDTFMPYHPGKRLRVHVDVAPVFDQHDLD